MYNYGLGYQSLFNVTNGVHNYGLGYRALYNLITGSFNIGAAIYAGRYFGDSTSPLTDASYGMFLGYDCRASANGNTDETVIGRTAVGNGSNTTTIGGASHKSLHVSGVIATTSYTVAALPSASSVPVGSHAFVTNGRKAGEGPGAGTGVPVWSDGVKWRTYYDNTEVQA